MSEKCCRCDKEAIGYTVDYFTCLTKYYCEDHFEDVAYIEAKEEDDGDE